MYEPLKLPLVQVRVCATEEQLAGAVTDEVEYAVTDEPLASVPPHGRVQEAASLVKSAVPQNVLVYPGASMYT